MQPVTFFKALSDPTRLKLIIEISAHDCICVCDLIEKLEQPQPTISRHLSHLRKAGLVTSERKGTWMWYAIAPDLPQWCAETISHIELKDV
ncbi:ArsR/SmtB family transcription factor [Psychrobacter piechaudii]|uniref:HTH-type transcriptional repressor AseR n=1 Tax=Psychrobacter piechaudii TaxID=1945521 RepID=A0A1R4GV25_9GAMM|nr:metalloregulator ArsR/SmtB family transcription factor [Psychrobacter piechaudii]SJM72057.1 HTH-type transcriptional repressor AseR [Psychrobacter piechaudii]